MKEREKSAGCVSVKVWLAVSPQETHRHWKYRPPKKQTNYKAWSIAHKCKYGSESSSRTDQRKQRDSTENNTQTGALIRDNVGDDRPGVLYRTW